jgi:PPM family protein phosphatase
MTKSNSYKKIQENIYRWLNRSARTGSIALDTEKVALASSLGKRSENQDCVVFYRFNFRDTHEKSLLGLILCDGMGGMVDGGDCASLAVSAFLSSLVRNYKKNLSENIKLAVYDSNDVIFEQYQGRGGTTLSSITFDSKKCIVANVGDSRIYRLLDNDTVEQLTVDDTLEQTLSNLNLPSPPRELMQLLQFVGMGKDLDFSPTPVNLDVESSYFILTSDGAHSYISPENFKDILLNSISYRDIADRLVTLSEWLGGRDNATVGVITPNTYSLLNQQELNESGSLEIWGMSGKVEFFSLDQTKHNIKSFNHEEEEEVVVEQKSVCSSENNTSVVKSASRSKKPRKKSNQVQSNSKKSKSLDETSATVVEIKFSEEEEEDIVW